MQNRKSKEAAKGQAKKTVSPISGRLNLKPNEAYEPGFGKYTLTESELRAGEINKQEVAQFTGKAAETGQSSQQAQGKQQHSSNAQAEYNGPGVHHYPAEPEKEDEQERRMRDENTRMHNNW